MKALPGEMRQWSRTFGIGDQTRIAGGYRIMRDWRQDFRTNSHLRTVQRMVCLAATVCLALAVGITGPADTAFAQASGGGLKSGVESSTAGDTRPIDEIAAGLDGVLTNEGVVSFGHVESLAGDVLRLSTVDGPVLTIERRQLGVVKFIIGQKSRAPPPLDTSTPGTDRILTYDGRVIAERVSGISEDSVTTERRTISRAIVDRILFSLSHGPSPTPEVPPPPTPPPEGDILGQFCSPDKPLGGEFTIEREESPESNIFCPRREKVIGRFRLDRPGVLRPNLSRIVGSDLRIKVFISGSCQTPPSWKHSHVCEDPGGQWSGRARIELLDFDPYWPHLRVHFRSPWESSNQCRSYSGEIFSQTTPVPGLLLTGIIVSGVFEVNPKHEWFPSYEVPRGPCWKEGTFEAKDECQADPKRFAVIPFTGNFESNAPNFRFKWTKASWKVCCGCGERFPPTAGTEPAEDENCFEHMASLLEFWKQEFAAREAALMNAQIELDWISVHYKSESRKQSEYMDAKNALADAYKSYRAEMANARRACMACAERQGLDPSQCPQYPPNDPRQD